MSIAYRAAPSSQISKNNALHLIWTCAYMIDQVYEYDFLLNSPAQSQDELVYQFAKHFPSKINAQKRKSVET